ncbi:MAG: hypothetical protein MPJ50_18875 [Pirellulales bacterium]|nr:hypothetical protein [Pirellulales bacterium]
MAQSTEFRQRESTPKETAAKVERCRALLAAKDNQFVTVVRSLRDHHAAAAVADLWGNDLSDWSRDQLLRYLDLPLDEYGQEPIIKRLFKCAESKGDHELMAAFLVAFDRCVRRHWRTIRNSSWTPDSGIPHAERLVSPANRMPLRKVGVVHYGSQVHRYPASFPNDARLFSHRTRYYLRRRAWRYFRRLGFQQPEGYVQGMCQALVRYTDADLAAGENIIDSWSLMQIAFGKHPAVDFGSTHVRLQAKTSLSKLSPAPRFLQLWQAEPACERLVELAEKARSRFVRRFALQLLQSEHVDRWSSISLHDVFRLLCHKDEAVSRFAAELLPQAERRDEVSLKQWLQLLLEVNPALTPRVCEVIRQQIDLTEVPFQTSIDLALQTDPSIARLGLSMLQQSHLARRTSIEQLPHFVRLANATCEVVAGEIVRFALSGLTRIADDNLPREQETLCDALLTFFDSPRHATRLAATDWLEAHKEHELVSGDPLFWSRVLETPYDDLRLQLVSILDARVPSPETQNVHRDAWRQVLVSIHRGSRLKLFVIEQLRTAIVSAKQVAEADLQALVLLARSPRTSERRHAVSCIVQLCEQRSDVWLWFQRELPELKIESNANVVTTEE